MISQSKIASGELRGVEKSMTKIVCDELRNVSIPRVQRLKLERLGKEYMEKYNITGLNPMSLALCKLLDAQTGSL